MKFILLHLLNGEEIYINADLIESFGTVTDKTYKKFSEGTYIVPNGMQEINHPYIVKESPAEIYDKIFS